MLPVLQSLVAVQDLDTAAEAARHRLAELPAAERQLEEQIAAAAAALEEVQGELAGNLASRRDLEKQVSVIDGRLARFDEHKASVKTNQEFTALLHEIEVAREGKDALEDQILALLEDADRIAAALQKAEQSLATTRNEADASRAALSAEQAALEADIERLIAARTTQTADVDGALLARYEQLLKQRRMLAVAALQGDVCGGCHVRLRPAVCQNVKRSVDIVQCDSCQRILYPQPVQAPVEDAAAQASGS